MSFRLLPKDPKFFELFVADGDNLQAATAALNDMVANYDRLDERVATIQALEKRGDEIDREVTRKLEDAFVTPFDREDIHALAEEIDDVVDDMKTVAQRVELLAVRSTVPWLNRQAELLVEMAGEAVQLMGKLPSMKGLGPHLEAIDRLESQADAIYNEALAHLFSGEFEALDVLRWKDLVEAMEAAINTMEDIGDVVESIMLKHA
jgi:uncharacterized protein